MGVSTLDHFRKLPLAVALIASWPTASVQAGTSEYEQWVQETAIAQANSSMSDTQLCLEGIETERFDPASGDCGESWSFAKRVAFFRKLILEMPPSINQ